MRHRRTSITRRKARQGYTLLELTLAMALFAVVLGATAQSLVTYHANIEMQNMRSAAAQNARGVLAAMREMRDDPTQAFPAAILAQWPDGQAVPGAGTLPGEQIIVTYADPAANPLEVTVVSVFNDMQGRPVRVQLGTALTGE
jgi:prepilin-type N-terminal cleavage/methylation domain-containing protein